jgi:hypothetical protein
MSVTLSSRKEPVWHFIDLSHRGGPADRAEQYQPGGPRAGAGAEKGGLPGSSKAARELETATISSRF